GNKPEHNKYRKATAHENRGWWRLLLAMREEATNGSSDTSLAPYRMSDAEKDAGAGAPSSSV
ncbi:hypothetical protein, partial [Ochrobactrum sp. P6BSIII]|uniref:hypothetical protein n=1 Tax=Ochrobactrum sp. P6BSIII TaxID=2587041 RepID=UPI001AEEC70F